MPALLNPNSTILCAAEGARSCPIYPYTLATSAGCPCASHGLCWKISDYVGNLQGPWPTLTVKQALSSCDVPRVTGYLFQFTLPVLNIHYIHWCSWHYGRVKDTKNTGLHRLSSWIFHYCSKNKSRRINVVNMGNPHNTLGSQFRRILNIRVLKRWPLMPHKLRVAYRFCSSLHSIFQLHLFPLRALTTSTTKVHCQLGWCPVFPTRKYDFFFFWYQNQEFKVNYENMKALTLDIFMLEGSITRTFI